MRAQLRIVSSNPHPLYCHHSSGAALRRLADRLTRLVRSGNSCLAHATVACEHLNPLGIAVVATWMYRAGLSEDQILAVMA